MYSSDLFDGAFGFFGIVDTFIEGFLVKRFHDVAVDSSQILRITHSIRAFTIESRLETFLTALSILKRLGNGIRNKKFRS